MDKKWIFLIISFSLSLLSFFIFYQKNDDFFIKEAINKNYLGTWKHSSQKAKAFVDQNNETYTIDYENMYCKMNLEGNIYRINLEKPIKVLFLNINENGCPFFDNPLMSNKLVFKINYLDETKIILTFFTEEEIKNLVENAITDDTIKERFEKMVKLIKFNHNLPPLEFNKIKE